MAGVGLYIRLGILETPIFRRLVEEKRIERTPVLEVIRRQPKEIILCALAKTAETAPAYIYIAFVFVYGTQVLHASREFLLSGADRRLRPGVLRRSRSPAICPTGSAASACICIGAVATGIFGFVYFAMLNSLVPALMFLAIMLSFVPHGLIFGPQAALFAECFTAAAALQRHVDRLSSRRRHRRRAGAADRDGAARLDRIGLRDRRLYRLDRDRQHRRDAAVAGSHQQGHLARARVRQSVGRDPANRLILLSDFQAISAPCPLLTIYCHYDSI